MPLFICDKCGVIENTVFGLYWTKNYDDLWDKKYLGKALCSEHSPTSFKSGEKCRFTGKWHGKFEKRFPTTEEVADGHFINRT